MKLRVRQLRSSTLTSLNKTHTATMRLGFTVVELLVVIIIIAILATITVVVFNGINTRATETQVLSDLRNAKQQLEIEKTVNGGKYPDSTKGVDGGKGLVPGGNVSYQYTASENGDVFCLTASYGATAYNVTQSGSPTVGFCPGHVAGGAVDGPVVAGCPHGFILVPGSATYNTEDFCVMKYEAKNVDGAAVSQPEGTPWVEISLADAKVAAEAACDGCQIMTEAERLTIAQNLMGVASNWSGGQVGSGYIYRGHSDESPNNFIEASSSDADGYYSTGNSSPSTQRRTLTLSNGQVIWDFAGNVDEMVDASYPNDQPGDVGAVEVEWNQVQDRGKMQIDPFPSVAMPAATNWTSVQGIGLLRTSNLIDTGHDGDLMLLQNPAWGGYYKSGAAAGIFGLGFYSLSGAEATNLVVGFRITRRR